MKVIAISSNQKKEENILSKITNSFLRGMKEEGAEINFFHTRNLEVYPCRGCTTDFDFESPGYCFCEDDMNKLYPYFKEADVWIFITPLEKNFMNRNMKIILDRMEPLFAPTLQLTNGSVNEEKNQGKVLLISASNNGNIKNFDQLIDNFSGLSILFDKEFAGSILRPGLNKIMLAESAGKDLSYLYNLACESGKQFAKKGELNPELVHNLGNNLFNEDSFFNEIDKMND